MWRGQSGTWLIVALALVFVALGILFVAAPAAGAALFGLPASDATTLAYVAAIGFRDLAFGLYLAALARLSSRRAVGTVMGLTALIPIGDVIIVAVMRGLSSPGHLLLHAGSGAVLVGGSYWLLRSDENTNGKDCRP
ncbi:MAG: DUF4267 domain-containing protein [Microvirga sp.]|jgi:hypothetical protein